MKQRILAPMLFAAATLSGAAGSGPAHSQSNPLIAHAERLVQPFLESTKRMVDIESPSLDEAGLRAMELELTRQIGELGGEVEAVPATVGPGKHVLGRWKGRGTSRILIVSHMDTVYPAGILKSFPWRREGDRVYGPGVLDDKGGIALALMAVRLLRDSGSDAFGTIDLAGEHRQVRSHRQAGSDGDAGVRILQRADQRHREPGHARCADPAADRLRPEADGHHYPANPGRVEDQG